jgi:Tol biopolymer transport system component
MDRPGFEADRLHLVLFDTATWTPRTLAYNFDRSISGFTWSSDSSRIFADADDDGYHKVFIVNRADESVTELLSTGDNLNLKVSPRNASDIFFLRHSLTAPTDVRSQLNHLHSQPHVVDFVLF